ncbi:MAG: DNA mismatch repair protein MutS, partial [Sphingobacteriia bacterium]
MALNKGKVIRAGVDPELDEYRSMATDTKAILQDIQEREAKATGIHSLKISFNNVFGYYLEVTHAHKEKVPPTWIRKQTLTNAERYITPELKNFEEKILGAEEKTLALETRLYQALVEELQPFLQSLQTNAAALAQLDVLACFAELAFKNHYAPAEIHTGDALEIVAGRHPVIEKNLGPDKVYIDNDLFLDRDQQQVIILTGPNMSGKSALLRQTALITLMAHMGSFVPATKARIPLTDKIFTRVGANDNLSGGESTFMVEMNETASILNNLSEKSLVILDEIGRGTATFDGISIAWSMVEFLQQSTEKPKTLFATHYHELNALEDKLSGVRNYHITHQESDNKV